VGGIWAKSLPMPAAVKTIRISKFQCPCCPVSSFYGERLRGAAGRHLKAIKSDANVIGQTGGVAPAEITEQILLLSQVFKLERSRSGVK